MVTNPGQRITFFEMAALFGKAYSNTSTLQKAVNGFASTGLWPFDPEVFTDEDFVASLVTEEEDPDTDRVKLISVARPAARDLVAGPSTRDLVAGLLAGDQPVTPKTSSGKKAISAL